MSKPEPAASTLPATGDLGAVSPDILVVIDHRGHLMRIAGDAERRLGYEPGELVGTNAMHLVHPDDLWEAADGLRLTQDRPDETRTPIALRLRRADGSYMSAEVLANNRSDDPDVGGIVLAIRDVTDRLDLVQALADAERRLRAVVRYASELILLMDAEGRVQYVSPALEPATGWRPDQVMGGSALDLIHPDDLDAVMEQVAPVFERPGAHRRVECRVKRRSGSWRHCEILFVNLFEDPAVGRMALYLRDITSRKEIETALADSEQRFRSLVAHSSDIIVVYDAQGTITYVSPAVERWLGYRPDELVGRLVADLADPNDNAGAHGWGDELRAGYGAEGSREFRVRASDGSWRVFDVWITNLVDDPAVGGFVANVRDVTDRQAAEAARRASEERFVSAFENAPIGMALQDLDGRFLQVNGALCDLLGYTRDELLRTTGTALTHPDDVDVQIQYKRRATSGELRSYRLEKRFVRSDGRIVWVKLSVSMVYGPEGSPQYAIAHIEDITGRRRDEERLTYQALHDALTGLPNRTLLLDRLDLALERARRGGPLAALLFCDLDRFKVVNDGLGHQVGDQLLVDCGHRLREVLRGGDTVARFGGDEFVVLCSEIRTRDEAVAVAQRVAGALEEPFVLGDHEFYMSTSIGIAFSDQATDADDLLRDADAAMYRAKEEGRARYTIFEPDMRSAVLRRAETERGLRRALDQGELSVYFQPVVRITDHAIVGAEALVRWQHPERGLVLPADFVPLAEETGLIGPLGAWVFDRTCSQVAAWDLEGLLRPGFWAGVNLSPRELTGPDFVARIVATVERTGVDPDRLCLELTESALADELGHAARQLREVRSVGVHLAIDDFGTGYSALSHLKLFPFDGFKIDRSFVDGLGRDPQDAAIVAAVVGVARALDLVVVAEGVETQEQAGVLAAQGVTLAQGFLFHRPLPAAEVTECLRAGAEGRPAGARW